MTSKYSTPQVESNELRTSCVRIVDSSQAPYRTLHNEAHRLRAKVNSGQLSAHDVWHELLVAATIAGIPARDASAILHKALTLSIEALP